MIGSLYFIHTHTHIASLISVNFHSTDAKLQDISFGQLKCQLTIVVEFMSFFLPTIIASDDDYHF